VILFEIHGDPVPQKQTRFCKQGDSIRAYDPSNRDKEMIQWQIKAFAPVEPLSCPVSLDITFFLPIPKSTSAAKKRQMLNQIILPICKPDVDNLAYILTNAMKKMFYKDDSQVVCQTVRKFYGSEPKTIIKVIPIHNCEYTRLSDHASNF
jgi:Holliday junction resolvase RusA-like endonuclease